MSAKPIKSLESRFTMIQFLLINNVPNEQKTHDHCEHLCSLIEIRKIRETLQRTNTLVIIGRIIKIEIEIAFQKKPSMC